MLWGLKFVVLTAEQQKRTPRDVRGPWVRPKTPSKARGRKGSRRRWKRHHPPHWMWFYREPEDMLKYRCPITGDDQVIVTPSQKAAILNAAASIKEGK